MKEVTWPSKWSKRVSRSKRVSKSRIKLQTVDSNTAVITKRVCAESLSSVWLFATPRTVACQAPLSMGFFRQGYWSGLPSPTVITKYLMFNKIPFCHQLSQRSQTSSTEKIQNTCSRKQNKFIRLRGHFSRLSWQGHRFGMWGTKIPYVSQHGQKTPKATN